jgi:sec-independent protein translocase protein TatB
MFDIGPTELLLIVVVAVIVIGPKDLPLALRSAGRWIGKLRKMSGHFRAGIDTMVREAELDDMEKKWKAQNEKIMREHPQGGPAEQDKTGAWPSAKPGMIAGASAEAASSGPVISAAAPSELGSQPAASEAAPAASSGPAAADVAASEAPSDTAPKP